MPQTHASFSSRVTVYFGTLFIAAFGVLFYLWYFGWAPLGIVGASSQRLQEAARVLEVKANLQHRLIAQSIEERRGDVLILADNETLARQLTLDHRGAAQATLRRTFQQLQRAYPGRYQRLQIIEPTTRRIVASSTASDIGSTYLDAVLVQRATQAQAHELVQQASTHTTVPALDIVRQIHATDASGTNPARTVGLLIAHVELQELVSDAFQERLPSTEPTGHTLLLDTVGHVLARYPPPSATSATSASVPFAPTANPGTGFEGTQVQTDAAGKPFVVVYRQLMLGGAPGWTLVHYSSRSDALGALNKSANTLIVVGLLMAFGALVLIGLAARYLTRPLHTLADAARALGAGDLFARLVPRPGESQEIAILSQAFNTMAEDIQKSHQVLEKTVLERTNELKRSEARHRTLFESSPDAVLLLDVNLVADCNPAAITLFGVHRREDLLGRHPLELSPPLQPDGEASGAAASRQIQRAVQEGSLAFEWLHHRLDTHETFLAEVLLNRVEVDGRLLMQGTVRNISERKRAEEQLRLSEENLAITLQSIGDAVIATDAQGHITRMNTTAERLTGWTLPEAQGRPLPEVFHIVNVETRSTCVNPVQLVMERGDVVGLANHTALLARDGQEHQISDSAAPIRNAAGDIVGVVLVFSDVTEDYRMRQDLLRTTELLRRTGELARVGGWEFDLQTQQFHWSPETFRIHDMEPPVPPAMEDALAQFLPESRPIIQAAMRKAVEDGTPYDLELQKITAKGRLIWVRAQGFAHREFGKTTKLYGALHDITERKEAEADLRIAAIAFESQEGMYVADAHWVILRVNSAFTDITGYRAEDALGKRPQELLTSGRHDEAFYAVIAQSVHRSGNWQGEVWDRRKNGEIYPVWLIITAVKSHEGALTHYVATMTDITQRKADEDQIKNLAFYDPLTQLPNRRLLINRLEKAIVTGVRNCRKGALLFVDLDNFKTLNDTLGHDKGDLLLQQVAVRLRTCVREGDTAARLGGDEFVVMLEDLSDVVLEAATQAEGVGEKILTALNKAYNLAGHEHHSTPSIGVTLFGGKHEGTDEPLKRADLAMYQAKAAGRNTLRFFDPQMQAVVTARAALETGLREALARGQFMLHYQVQVSSTSFNGPQFTGAEVLVRWNHPERGLVSPAEFIPLAEETGLILPLGQWVLESACRQLAQWATQPALASLTVAVNVSALQFGQTDFVDRVLATLARTGANPQRLKMELTEGSLVLNVEDVITKMTALRAHGVRFSLDDFGTGYSSLSYLKRLPLSQLKIDQGFVRDVLLDANDAAIAKMVIVLADSLGLSVIAEGVETTAQRDFLAGQGCHNYQGYLFSKPLPVDTFEALVLAGPGQLLVSP